MRPPLTSRPVGTSTRRCSAGCGLRFQIRHPMRSKMVNRNRAGGGGLGDRNNGVAGGDASAQEKEAPASCTWRIPPRSRAGVRGSLFEASRRKPHCGGWEGTGARHVAKDAPYRPSCQSAPVSPDANGASGWESPGPCRYHRTRYRCSSCIVVTVSLRLRRGAMSRKKQTLVAALLVPMLFDLRVPRRTCETR